MQDDIVGFGREYTPDDISALADPSKPLDAQRMTFLLGHVQYLVLAVADQLSRLDRAASGSTISAELARILNNPDKPLIDQGQLYNLIRRLSKDYNYLEPDGPPRPQPGTPPVVSFRLTAAGRQALAAARETYARLAAVGRD